MIGNSTAITITSTTAPITTIISGSSNAVMPMARRSMSRDRVCAARSSIGGSEPVFSPLAIRWINTGGNTFSTASAGARLTPSRTLAVASLTHWLRRSLDRVWRAASRARNSGTPAPPRIARVEAKRAVFRPSTKRPISGNRSTRLCQFKRATGSRRYKRQPQKLPTIPAKHSQPQARIKSLALSIARVSPGRSWRAWENALTTWGTT